MIDVLVQLISCAIMEFAHVYVWTNVLKTKLKFKSLKTIFLLILMPFIILLNYLFVFNYMKIVTITLILMVFCKLLFNVNLKKAIIAPIVSQFVLFVAEFAYSLVLMTMTNFDSEKFVASFFGTLVTNIVICILSLVLIRLKLFNKIFDFLSKITKNIRNYELLITIVVLLVSFNLIIASVYYEIDLKWLLILNTSLICIYCFIIIKMANTQNKYLVITSKYNNSKNSLTEYQSVITRYRIDNHENKSRYEILKSKINPENIDAIEYVDRVLGTRIKDNDEVLNKTKIIPECDFRTLIDTKVMKMDEMKIDNTIHVDKKITTTDFIEMDEDLVDDACKVLGVFLDNAIEAVEKLREKEVQIDIYKMDGCMHISVINNYEGKIDISSINEPGYTTKSTGHGYGLALVSEIVEKNKKLSKDTYIDKNIFKQVLNIKL